MEGRIKGVSVCRRAPRITNLLFANDSLLFCQANKKEVKEIIEILKMYASSLGQCINLDKSSVYFRGITLNGTKKLDKRCFGSQIIVPV